MRQVFTFLLTALFLIPLNSHAFFYPASFDKGFLKAGAAANPLEPTSDWLFNEIAGTVAEDRKNIADFTVSGTYVWNSGSLDIDCDTVGNYFALPDGGYYDLNSFTVAVWIEFDAVGTTKQIINMGNFTSASVTNYAWKIDYSGTAGPRAYTSNGSAATATTGQGVLTTGTKYLVLYKYQRVGGAADNVLTSRVTSNGTTWAEHTITNANLIQQVSSFELRSSASDGNGVDAKYYRVSLWADKITTTEEDDDIWALGSEGSY